MEDILYIVTLSSSFGANWPMLILILLLIFFIAFGETLIRHVFSKAVSKSHEEFVGHNIKGPWVDFNSESANVLVCNMYNFDLSKANGSENAMFTTLLHKISDMHSIVESVNEENYIQGKLFSFKIHLKDKVNILALKDELEHKIKIHFSLLIPQSRIYFKTY